MFMSAHIVFDQIDAQNPATQSAKVIQTIIREHMAFDGLLMTDDINMKALSGEVTERSKKALAAGCDMILHCNGNFDEMAQIGEVIQPLDGNALQRATKAEQQAFAQPLAFDINETKQTLDNLLRN
jgi:beta-N-acetylhexosaminidase